MREERWPKDRAGGVPRRARVLRSATASIASARSRRAWPPLRRSSSAWSRPTWGSTRSATTRARACGATSSSPSSSRREGPLDLLVWPESAATFRLPRDPGVPIEGYFHRAIAFYGLEDPGFPRTPLLFGGLSSELGEGENRLYNTAFLTDDQGRIAAHYDKTYLLAFGEYLPLGETFPILYEWSPNTGHFTPGDHVHSLPFGEHRIGALVCYEDILPGFVRAVMNEDDPQLLVNVTNDAWFGDTQEPWVHLALAEMRAVEHHRYLIRATNTGVSAIIDPLGRVTEHSEVFERASLRGEVRMMEGHSVYRTTGNWPGWLSLIAMAYLGFIGRRPPRPQAPEAPAPKRPAPRAASREDEEE
ncbi:MAG: apolipoprotein N-acyltransferase [Myxococcales bacterium]|nr:apolipoprotein N-acyltransferase [Myxococcales bacterium]